MYGGMGGGYGMGGMRGDNTMMMVMCCVCLVCIASLAIGYFTGAFCSVSPALGRCQGRGGGGGPDEEEEMDPGPLPSGPPSRPGAGGPTGGVDLCSESWGSTPRTGNDPRPPIRPEYCQSAARVVGRDCYYWKVEADPVTGRARWMRVADDAKGDMRTGAECAAQVKCPLVIDPASLPRYSELEPTELLKQCTAVAATATNQGDTLKFLTQAAAEVSANWTDTAAWTDSHSKVWYDGVMRYVGQKDLSVYISNSAKAATTVKNKFNMQSLRKSTFAYILEAAVRSPENRADWIIDIVNVFNNRALTAAQANEAFFVAYLRGLVPGMVAWEKVIENPTALGAPAAPLVVVPGPLTPLPQPL